MQEQKCTTVSFSERFFDLTKNSGLNQKELSQRLELSEGAVINYKRGRIPKAEELLKIAKYFGTTIEWLLTGEQSESTPISKWQEKCIHAESRLTESESRVRMAISALEGVLTEMKKNSSTYKTNNIINCRVTETPLHPDYDELG